jgi:hypothetical protein
MEGFEPMEVDVLPGDTSAPRMHIQLNGFDTVVAITQQAINAHFKNLWRIGAIHKNLSIALNAKRKLEGSMDAPRVKVGTGDTKYITFILPIISGSFSYLNLEEEPETVDIKDWKLAFRVKVDYRTVEQQEVPQEVWERVKNLGPGMFSMRQLFMDFQTANFAELDLSESVVPKSVIDSGYLAMYMKRYFAKVTEDGHNILGYAVQVHNPNQAVPECPSFPPTDLTFATHRYEDGTSAPDPEYDTLTYLIMTRNRPMPLNVVPQGQFFDPKAQDKQSGTMIIARSVFIDDYLIPRLARSTALRSTLKKSGDRSVWWDVFYGDGAYTFKDGKWQHFDEQSVVSETFELWGALFPSNLTWKLTNSSTISIVPATNMIVLNGSTVFYYEDHCWAGVRGDNNALQEILWQQATSTWSLTLTFNSVSTATDTSGGGELNVDVNFNIGHTYKEDGNILGQLELQLNPGFKEQGERIFNSVSSMMNSQDIGGSVKRALQNTNRFVFPGGQAYSFKDPLFTPSYDLLVGTTLNFY